MIKFKKGFLLAVLLLPLFLRSYFRKIFRYSVLKKPRFCHEALMIAEIVRFQGTIMFR